MSKVHILSPDIISKIAAGEVIERPASVIKELIENSLDAGTKSVELHLKDAGKTLLRLKDTGSGIAKDDIETIFQRHATSKLQSVDDLFNIHSLGFRGEALYSIAAISDVILRSRASGEDSGWEIHIRSGERKDLRPSSLPVGTEIEVKELFFNTPARRKFLKSNTAEVNQVLNIFIPYCLFFPEVRFLLTHEDRTLLDLRSTKSFPSRAAEALSFDEKNILETDEETFQNSCSARMLLGDINVVRSRRDMQFIFVNGRPVQSKNISYHLNEIYRLLLPPRNFPFFALFLKIPESEVDVNIHPTKREVKIKDETVLCSFLRHHAENALMTLGKAKQVHGPQSTVNSTPTVIDRALHKASGKEFDASFAPPGTFEPSSPQRSPTDQYTFPQTALFLTPDGEKLSVNKDASLKSKLAVSRSVGSFLNKFLFFEAGKSLLIVDQHAAQERITFEQLILQMDKGKVEVQNLLTPYLLKISLQDFLVWEEMKENLEEMGFSTTQFDKETLAIHSYPVLLKDPQRAVQEILGEGAVARSDHESLARRACRASVMSGDALTATQAEFQRQQLLKCRDPFTCPHGRPTVVELSETFLDRQFLRT